jgi:Ser/Thr protein kinase RdoA (MazF antagonist)
VAPAPDDRRHPARRLDYAVGLLTEVLPSDRDAVARAAEAVERGLSQGWAPTAFIHGDLYDDQVFVAEDFSLGLVDLDDAGPGDPALDAANLCAHLLAMTLAAPAAAHRLVAYRELVRAAFLERLGITPQDLAWREALALLLLATGPYRVQADGWPAQSRHLIDLAVRLTAVRPEAAWPTCS